MHITKMPAGPALNALVVQHIMGKMPPGKDWRPSQDEEAAQTALARFQADYPGATISRSDVASDQFRCSIRLPPDEKWRVAYSTTRALAICGALLQAVGVKEVQL